MSVKKENRNQGVGYKMLVEVLNWAKSGNKVKKIELNVFEKNIPAVKLYKKIGFEIEGLR